jgi:hypothetical protein
LRVTATSLQDEKWPVVSETEVRVDFSIAPSINEH